MRNAKRDRALILISYTMLATFTIGYLVGIMRYEEWNPLLLIVMVALAYCAGCFGSWVYTIIPEDDGDDEREINDPTLAFGKYLFDKND